VVFKRESTPPSRFNHSPLVDQRCPVCQCLDNYSITYTALDSLSSLSLTCQASLYKSLVRRDHRCALLATASVPARFACFRRCTFGPPEWSNDVPRLPVPKWCTGSGAASAFRSTSVRSIPKLNPSSVDSSRADRSGRPSQYSTSDGRKAGTQRHENAQRHRTTSLSR
jgi:hypothetical protein